MKKTLASMIVMLISCLMISGCGSKGNMDLTKIISTISWTMTRQDVISKEGTPDENKDSIIVYYEKTLSGYNGEYIYGFDDDDSLRFLKFSFTNDSDFDSYISEFRSKNGDPDKTKHNGSLTFYWWYGTVNGEKASFSYQDGVSMVEVDKE